MTTVKNLEKEIRLIFPKHAPPNRNEITSHEDCCEDGRNIVRDFAGKNWWQMDTESVQSNHGNLPVFKVQAYFYYLPAYLLNCLEDFTGDNIVIEFVIYDLEGYSRTRIEDDDFMLERAQLFSLDQVKVLIRFLKLVINKKDDESLTYDKPHANRALEFWKKWLANMREKTGQ